MPRTAQWTCGLFAIIFLCLAILLSCGGGDDDDDRQGDGDDDTPPAVVDDDAADDDMAGDDDAADDDIVGDEVNEANCRTAVDYLYDDCSITLIIDSNELTKEEAYDHCLGNNEETWRCIFRCIRNKYGQCLKIFSCLGTNCLFWW